MGLSKPHCARTSATCCGVARRPARRSAGSPLGMAWKIRKVTTEIANSTATTATSRWRMKRAMSVLDAHLRARVEGVADPVAADVDPQHRGHEHQPRHDRQVDRARDQPDAVGDHRPPRWVRVLNARAEV